MNTYVCIIMSYNFFFFFINMHFFCKIKGIWFKLLAETWKKNRKKLKPNQNKIKHNKNQNQTKQNNKNKQEKIQTKPKEKKRKENNDYNTTMTWIHIICNKNIFNYSIYFDILYFDILLGFTKNQSDSTVLIS